MSEEQLKELRKALRDAVMALVKLTFTIDDLLAERREEDGNAEMQPSHL